MVSAADPAEAWATSPFTGLFLGVRELDRRAPDPDVTLFAGSLTPTDACLSSTAVGAAGWDARSAWLATVGEGVERWQPWPLPGDRVVQACFGAWTGAEPAVDPARWVLYLPEQYSQVGFPFASFTDETEARWVRFRRVADGEPWWVPEDFAYLFPRPGESHRITASISTGLACGRAGDPVILRGLQEVIERDALMGAWWGAYPLREWPADRVFAALPPALARRALRPHLRYRFWTVGTPHSAHVTICALDGADDEGWSFCAGAACRETRAASFAKALLEAIQGRPYVRWLRTRLGPAGAGAGVPGAPAGFAEHAVYYTLNPERLAETPLATAPPAGEDAAAGLVEGLDDLLRRLGPDRAPLFRLMTPPGVVAAAPQWQVVKVVVPGLQPMHGHHDLPALGGPLWAPRGLDAWRTMLPHPFP